MEKDKYLVSFRSENKKTGPIMVTSSPRASCPTSCKWNKHADRSRPACYAGKGFFGQFIWGGLDRTDVAGTFGNGVKVYSFQQLLNAIRLLIPGEVWRHNQAGDLVTEPDCVTIDREKLRRLVEANHGRRCFTFTHHDVFYNQANRAAVKEACDQGFMINLSADTLVEADALADLGIAPVAVVVPTNQTENTITPRGRKVTICPARRAKGVTCQACQICTKRHKAIIAFPEL